MIAMTIKNMVCRHCVSALENCLDTLGIKHGKVEIGRVELEELNAEGFARLDEALNDLGFVRAGSHDEAIVEQIKLAVRHHVRSVDHCRLKLSACIEEQTGLPFERVSRIFSRLEGRTVENYAIAQRVELVKELLAYGGESLAAIADRTGYSSAAHLSRQFKSITGMTPGQYQKLRPARTSLDSI